MLRRAAKASANPAGGLAARGDRPVGLGAVDAMVPADRLIPVIERGSADPPETGTDASGAVRLVGP